MRSKTAIQNEIRRLKYWQRTAKSSQAAICASTMRDALEWISGKSTVSPREWVSRYERLFNALPTEE
jgi:hypothetical protein